MLNCFRLKTSCSNRLELDLGISILSQKQFQNWFQEKKFFFWQKWQKFFSVYFFIFHHQHCSNEVSSPSFVFVKLLIWNLKHSLPLSKSSTKLLLHLFSLLHCLDIFSSFKSFFYSVWKAVLMNICKSKK